MLKVIGPDHASHYLNDYSTITTRIEHYAADQSSRDYDYYKLSRCVSSFRSIIGTCLFLATYKLPALLLVDVEYRFIIIIIIIYLSRVCATEVFLAHRTGAIQIRLLLLLLLLLLRMSRRSNLSLHVKLTPGFRAIQFQSQHHAVYENRNERRDGAEIPDRKDATMFIYDSSLRVSAH